MEQRLQGMHWKSLLFYLDYIMVISSDFPTCLRRLEEVLQCLHRAGLKLTPAKCELLQKNVTYLGRIVSSTGVLTNPGKIAAIRDWPAPHFWNRGLLQTISTKVPHGCQTPEPAYGQGS